MKAPSGRQFADRKLPRDQRLRKAKTRALRYVEEGDLVSPLTSMWRDTMCGRNPLYPREFITERLVNGIEMAREKDEPGIRQWIEEFW